MTTLAQAIERRQRQAALAGWRMSKRRHIAMQADGIHAILRLGWINPSNSMAPSEGASIRVGDDTIAIDLDNLPPGISALEWTALPDTEDLIAAPSLAEIKSAARALGCPYVDKIEGKGILTYCMVTQ